MDLILSSFFHLLILITIFLFFMLDAVFWHSLGRLIIYNVMIFFLKLIPGFQTWFWWEQYVSYIITTCLLLYKLNMIVEDHLMWIRRERKLLSAVRDDISKFKAGNKIETIACQVLSSDHNQELEESLQRAEEWVKGKEKMIEKLGRFTSAFEVTRHGNFLWQYLQFLQIKQVCSICWNFPTKDDFKNVKGFYESLEKSRFRLRSLQENAVEYESEFVVASASARARTGPQVGPIRKHASSVLEKVRQESQNMQEFELKMILLEGFLKDVEDVELESEIERAWIDEVKAFMGDVEHAIDTFNQRKEQNKRLPRLCRFILYFLLLAEPLFSQEVKSLAGRLAELVEATEIYGFQFSRSQEQSHPYHKDLADLQESIRSLLEEINGHLVKDPITSEKDINDSKEFCAELEKMRTILKKMEVIEGASKFRYACLEQMNKIKGEAKKNFTKYIEYKRGQNPSLQCLKTSPIKNAIEDIKRSVNAYNKVRLKLSSTSTSTLGLEEDTEALVEWLLNEGRDSGYIYSIVGMQGIGKTTLANTVYHHGVISNKFPIRIWASLPEGSNDITALLKGVSKQLKRNDEQPAEEGTSEDDWIHNIRNLLKDKKYLIVLDNISTKTVWNKLEAAFRPFPERCDGRILLTTRDKSVALHADERTKARGHQLELTLRSKEESWKMFKEKMHFSTQVLSQVETKRKAEENVARCEGLPSTISCLGFLMSGRNLNGQELSMSEKLGEIMVQHEKIWSKHWEIIQGNLSGQNQHLRNLVTFFTLFPPRFEIPVRRLIAIWIAEELVQKSGDKEVEDTAVEFLQKLIGFNLIQPVKKNVDGKLKTCRLPSALYQRVADTGSDTYKIKIRRHVLLSKSRSSNPRPVDHHATSRHIRDAADPFFSDKEIVTFISFDTRDGDEPAKDIHVLCKTFIANGSFRKLKVLDLERVFRPHLPENILELTELRYLGLRWTFLEEIPKTIGKLQRLQTLDLKHTNIRTLPSTVWSLENLRHLYLNHAYWSKLEHQTKRRNLHNLQTLWGVLLHEENPLKESLQHLKGLRKLELAIQLSTDKQEQLLEKVAKLNHLHTLRLRSIWRARSNDVRDKTQDLCLVDMSALHSLSSLYLYGKLNNTADKLESLPVQYLCDLTLSATGLQDDPMKILKRLTNLRSLCLFANSFKGESMESSAESFPWLVVLKLWKLDGLKVWNIQENTMKSLKELEIRCCQHLEVPNGLKHLKSLRELKLRDMPEKFTKRLVLNEELNEGPKKEPAVWDNISHMPAIITYS